MKVALFKGKSFISLAIRWLTRSPFSHAAILFDEASESAGIAMIRSGCEFKRLHYFSKGSVLEAWQGGVKNSPRISTLHTPGTPVCIMSLCHPETEQHWPLSRVEEEQLLALSDSYVGTPYDYWDVIRFITRQNGHPHGKVFCSFLVDILMRKVGRGPFARTEGWRVAPDALWRTRFLKFEKEVRTN